MTGKPKGQPVQKETTPTTEKAGPDIVPAEKDDDHGQDTLSNEEMAAFDNIMDEIEDQEIKKISGSSTDEGTEESGEQILPEDLESPAEDRAEADDKAKDTVADDGFDADQQKAFESIMSQIEGGGSDDAEPDASPPEPSEPGATDDFSAELEKVVQEAEAAEAPPAAVEAADDGLDADQQKAFESIMSQIEGGGSDDADPNALPPEPSEAGATDDFSAELEKVVQEAEAAEAPPTAVEAADDGLDADQQKAFESIMSQIEGGGSDDADPDALPPEPSEAGATDDFSAELEQIAQEADIQEARSPVDEKDAEHLDADLPAVVDDLKDPIEVGDNPKAAENLKSKSMDPEQKELSECPEVNSGELENDKSEDESHDISDDIDDILKEISASEDQANLPEKEDSQIVLQEVASKGPAEDTFPEVSLPADKKESSDISEEKAPTDPLPVNPADDAKPSSPDLKAPETTEPLRETPASTGGGKKKIGLAVTVVIFLFAMAGYFYWGPKDRIDSTGPIPAQDTRDGETEVSPDPVAKPEEPVIADFGTSDESRLKTAAGSLDRLRRELIAKKDEIEELRAYYQAGIDAEIQAVADTVRESGKGGISFNSAMAEPRISLGLAAIQRRDTYIKKLVVPAATLFRNSEELLFLSRRAELLTLMAGKTSDIDIDGFIQQAIDTSQAHRSAMDQLNIDEVPVSPLALETIWTDIAERLSTAAVKPEITQPSIKTDNAKIWKDICDGDYSEKHTLTALSQQAARCLATWKGKDLFLNELTDLSPEAARQLASWDGDWLGLNGLRELSPEAAVHLARWKGKGLSLNGLSRLSPRVVAILSEWQGDQIELVNVKHMAYWENPKTRLFLSEDLKRKRNAARN